MEPGGYVARATGDTMSQPRMFHAMAIIGLPTIVPQMSLGSLIFSSPGGNVWRRGANCSQS